MCVVLPMAPCAVARMLTIQCLRKDDIVVLRSTALRLAECRLLRYTLLGTLLVAGALVPAGPLHGRAQAASGPITYAYDQAGRLTAVVDPGQPNAGVYAYDPAGNVTSIGHQPTGQVSVLGFAPRQGAAGTSVTITGTAFSATASNDTVKFNGTAASVSSAGPTYLVVTVPGGATTGSVSVSVTGMGSASSSGAFTVAGPILPSISSLSA